MTIRRVPFKWVQPYQFFSINDQTWVKRAAVEVIRQEPVFNAYLLTDELLLEEGYITVPIQHFDDNTLVEVDTDLPRFNGTLQTKILHNDN